MSRRSLTRCFLKVFIRLCPIAMVTVYNNTIVMLYTYHFRCVDPILLIHISTQFKKNLNYFQLVPNMLPRTFLLNHGDVNIYIWYSISSGNWTIDEWKCSNIAICDYLYTILLSMTHHMSYNCKWASCKRSLSIHEVQKWQNIYRNCFSIIV